MRKFIVVGSGISGMYAALRIKMANVNYEVTLLETQSKLGGLLSGIDVAGINFDTGVHTFYETGHRDLDEILYSIIPSGGWVDLVGTGRDIGGAFYGGSMHFGNAYLGFQHLNPNQRAMLEKEFLELPAPDGNIANIASDYLAKRYGKTMSEEYLNPIVQKFTGRPAHSVHSNVASILPLSRVNLLSHEIDTRVLSGDAYNSRLAFSDQRRMPTELVSTRKAYYPRRYGTQLYIDAFEHKLNDLGVRTIKSVKISDIQLDRLVLNEVDTIEFDEVIWTPNPLSFSRFTQKKATAPKVLPIQKTAIVSYVVKSEPNMKDLYYAYSHDPRHSTHRFSSPVTFCDDSKVADGFRFTNEIVYHDNLTESEIENISTSELEGMGIFYKSDIKLAHATKIEGGYPDLSHDLVLDALRNIDELKNMTSRNIHFVGMLSKPNLFFQNDILVNTNQVVESLI